MWSDTHFPCFMLQFVSIHQNQLEETREKQNGSHVESWSLSKVLKLFTFTHESIPQHVMKPALTSNTRELLFLILVYAELKAHIHQRSERPLGTVRLSPSLKSTSKKRLCVLLFIYGSRNSFSQT